MKFHPKAVQALIVRATDHTEKNLLRAYRFILREYAEVYGGDPRDADFLQDAPPMVKRAYRYMQRHKKRSR